MPSDKLEYLMIKDPHFSFSFRNNIRKAGWERAIDDKLTQIIDYALLNQISSILFTGDVFEKSKRRDWSFAQFQANKKRLQRFKDAGLVVYSNLGNHDMMDGSEDISGTVFGEMRDLGLINYIGTGMNPYVFEVGSVRIGLFGIDHHQNQETILEELSRISLYPEIDYKIMLMHSNVTDTNTRLTDFTYNQLSTYSIDIINCGHWHLEPEGGAIQDLNGTYFLNPWNLTRVMRDYHVKLDEHKPSFIHSSISVDNNDIQSSFKEIELRVLPFSEAFNPDIINLLQELGKDSFKFFEKISLDQDDDISDDETLIDSLAKAYDISENSIKIAKELLT